MPAKLAPGTQPPNWISSNKARAILGLNKPAMRRLLAKGVLTVRQIPGSWVQIDEASVRALAESSVKLGTVGAA